MRVAAWALGSLLLGGVAVLGSVCVFRQGLLPLIDRCPAWARMAECLQARGIPLAAIAGDWAYAHWYERREATSCGCAPFA